MKKKRPYSDLQSHLIFSDLFKRLFEYLWTVLYVFLTQTCDFCSFSSTNELEKKNRNKSANIYQNILICKMFVSFFQFSFSLRT